MRTIWADEDNMSRWGRPVERQHSFVQVGPGLGSSSPDSRWFQNLPVAHLSMHEEFWKLRRDCRLQFILSLYTIDTPIYSSIYTFTPLNWSVFLFPPKFDHLLFITSSKKPRLGRRSSEPMKRTFFLDPAAEAKSGRRRNKKKVFFFGIWNIQIVSQIVSHRVWDGSDQKLEAAWGREKQEQSIFLFQHLKYSNLDRNDMNVIFLSQIATECEVAVVAVGGEKQGKSNFLRLIWEGFPPVCSEKVFAVHSEKVVCCLLWEGFLHVYSEKVFCSEKVFRPSALRRFEGKCAQSVRRAR